MKRVVLVTGGNGMIGRNFRDIKLSDEFTTVYSGVNLEIEEQVYDIFSRVRPDIVLHLASKVAGLYGNMSDNMGMLSKNCLINMNVVNACEKFKVGKLINILSTCIFPDKIEYPLKSENIMNGEPHCSNIGYATSKRLLYTASKLLSNTRVVNLIPTNMYGKYDNYNENRSHVIPALIKKFKDAKRDGENVIISGTGVAKRQFLYAGDFVEIIKFFIENDTSEKFESLIVSPPEEISIRELSLLIKELISFENEIEYDSSFSDGQITKTCDSSELKKWIQDFKFISLSDGLLTIL